ncbi:MAG: TetR/AcrR family transcriptional regulator [Blastomonas sp.]|nr:TetR/AcrR family transcriptional regulator [Blastomonas sp.]
MTISLSPEPAALTKGQRTRRRLMEASLALLAKVGFHDLKTTEVAKEAGVAAGVFYTYFKDKNEIVLAVFDAIVDANTKALLAQTQRKSAFATLLESNRAYIQFFVEGGGLNRAIGQIVDTLPEARRSWQKANARFAQAIAERIIRQQSDKSTRVDPFFAAMALQAMLDSILLQVFAYRDPGLAEYAADPDELAWQISILWYRAEFGCDPELVT